MDRVYLMGETLALAGGILLARGIRILAKGEASLFQRISREYTKQTGIEIKAVLLRTGAVRVAFFRGPDGEVIEFLEDKTGYT